MDRSYFAKSKLAKIDSHWVVLPGERERERERSTCEVSKISHFYLMSAVLVPYVEET